MKKNEKVFIILKNLILKHFPESKEKDISSYLTSPQNEYFNLSPVEFASMNEIQLKTVKQNIKNYNHSEIMGS